MFYYFPHLSRFLVTLVFPPLLLLMGVWVFAIFLGLQLAFIVYIWKFVPETKGKSIAEINALFS